MAHTVHEKKKLLNRVRRLRGQIEAIEKALVEEDDPDAILQQVAACRGALQGLMARILEGHIYEHLLGTDDAPETEQARAAELLVGVIRTYLR